MNCIVLLGPTAVGKTGCAVGIAKSLCTEIISADSRQVYKGLDVGSGKDLCDYDIDGVHIPYHLIDVTDVSQEYNVFNFQEGFYKAFKEISAKGKIPLICGGTGMYIDAVVRGYDFLPVPENKELRDDLAKKSLEEIDNILLSLKPDLHNKTDLEDRDRATRAIEIATFMKSEEAVELRKKLEQRPFIEPFILGMTLQRNQLRENIRIRLEERMNNGLIEEVSRIHEEGASWERLECLGLEYKFVSEYLEGKISSKEELFTKLYTAICQFAKRQETWFRGMERKGVKINWIPESAEKQTRIDYALNLIKENI